MCHPLTLICTFSLVAASLVVLAGVMAALAFYAYGDFASTTTSITYGPGDTQSLFFSPLLCEKLSPASSTLYSSEYEPSYLYVLSEEPTLTGEVNITFQDQETIFDQHHQRNFHFYSNSVIAFEVCVDNSTYSGFGSFYLIKSQKLYNEWAESSEQNVPHYMEYLQVRKICSQENQTFAYKVTEEDQYYLVFVNDKHVDPQQPSEIAISYNILRTVYEFDSSAVEESCGFTTSPCSLRVPFRKTAAAVLVYGAPVNWEGSWKNALIDVNCGLRIWLYAVLCAAGCLLIAAASTCLCLSCYCCCYRCFSAAADEMRKPLLNRHTAGLLDGRSNSQEMSEPTGDVRSTARATPSAHVAIRSPHPPPSFKTSSGKFSMGSPTYETFAS